MISIESQGKTDYLVIYKVATRLSSQTVGAMILCAHTSLPLLNNVYHTSKYFIVFFMTNGTTVALSDFV